ncbi:MAG: OmpA family protein [Bacteroidetes bacterium]|nr:OmpA family protein [Bacteroidota bacterium]
MKKIFLFISLFVLVQAQGQILKKIADKAKQKAEEKANKKADESIEKKKSDEDTNNKTTENKNTEVKDTTGKNETTPAQPASLKVYSKYDFVPGEKVIGFEDFSTGNIGDFPAGWNTNGSGEIVTIEGKEGRWLVITKPGVYLPEFTDKYPDDFTFEFDLLHGVPTTGATLNIVLGELTNTNALQGWNTSPHILRIGFHNTSSNQKEGAVSSEIRKSSTSQPANQIYTELLSDKYNPVHVSIWRQKERVRVYVNQEKLWDIPRAISAEAKLNAIFFPVFSTDENSRNYIGNLRLAIGAPDTRKKIMEQNKWVTHGILFDVNKATIKPESYGTLKEMANVLKEYTDLKVKIVGHTDADGKDTDNLDLSKRRAASVKAALAKEFGIEESRMETDGKGESEPIDKNDNPAGKANNRRVEFIKIQ